MDEIGRRVKACRESKSMTMADLARATGLSPGAISRIERGERAPGSATLTRLAEVLAVDPGYLIRGQPSVPPALAPPLMPPASPTLSPDGVEVLAAFQLIAAIMPTLPPAGRARVLRILEAALR